MDRGTWQASVQGFAKSQTQLSTNTHTHTHTHTHNHYLKIHDKHVENPKDISKKENY